MICNINYASEFSMKYGHVAMINNGDTFSCAIVIYDVKFKLKDECIETGMLWWKEVKYEPVSLTPRCVQLIQNSYLPHVALKAFKNEGLIQAIEYHWESTSLPLRWHQTLILQFGPATIYLKLSLLHLIWLNKIHQNNNIVVWSKIIIFSQSYLCPILQTLYDCNLQLENNAWLVNYQVYGCSHKMPKILLR